MTMEQIHAHFAEKQAAAIAELLAYREGDLQIFCKSIENPYGRSSPVDFTKTIMGIKAVLASRLPQPPAKPKTPEERVTIKHGVGLRGNYCVCMLDDQEKAPLFFNVPEAETYRLGLIAELAAEGGNKQ